MARMKDFEADNANISQQHKEWRQQRTDAGEDPSDWSAFREHLMAIGAPDPGEEEASDFRDEHSGMGDMQTTRETQTI